MAIGAEAPWIPGSTDKLKTIYTYDQAKAKQLLREAGFPNGFTTTLYSAVGRYMMDKQVCEAIQAQLAQVGIKVEYKTVDWSILTDMLRKGQDDAMFLLGKGSPSADLDMTGMITFRSDGSNNYMFLKSPEIDKLLDAQRIEVDATKRAAILATYLERVNQEAPWASLHYEKQLIAARSTIKGLRVVPNEFIDMRYVTKQ
jgi:ABC-type transport system substrate-binding protein